MKLLSLGCACHAVWPERPLLPAVGGGGLLGGTSRDTIARPAAFSVQTSGSAEPRLPHGLGSAGRCPVHRYPPKNAVTLPPPHVPHCAVPGVTVLEGPLGHVE